MQEPLNLLGLKVKDRITGIEAIVTSISFDLYGCIQAIINSGLDKELKPRENYWFDIQRLEILSSERLMEVPAFPAKIKDFRKGPEDKPVISKV